VTSLSFGLILLFVLTVAVYFGFAERILDRMRLTDTQAILFLALMILGSFVSISIPAGQAQVSINLGGFAVPLAIAVYLIVKAGTTWERVRSLLAAVGTSAAIWGIASITDFGPEGGQTGFIDSLWLYSLIGGLVAYVLGRSRRAAFVAGTLGIILADLVYLTQVLLRGLPSTVALGGAGVLDATVLAGVIAVGLAELIGESRERIQGGPELGADRPLALRVDEGVADEAESNKFGSDDGGDRS
jgi:uncharacterized membrane protein